MDELSPVEKSRQSKVLAQGRASSQGRQDIPSCTVLGSKARICILLGNQHEDKLSKFRILFSREKRASATTMVASKGLVRTACALIPPCSPPSLVKQILQWRMDAWMGNLGAGAAVLQVEMRV